MLFVVFHYWEGSMNTLQLRCGKIAPTSWYGYAHIGLKHVMIGLQLDSKIKEMKTGDSQLDDNISLLKKLLDALKTNFA